MTGRVTRSSARGTNRAVQTTGGGRGKKKGEPEPPIDDNAALDEIGAGAGGLIPQCPGALLGPLRALLQPLVEALGTRLDRPALGALKGRLSRLKDLALPVLDELVEVLGNIAEDDWGAPVLAVLRLEGDAGIPFAALLTPEAIDDRLLRFEFPGFARVQLRTGPDWAAWRELPALDARFVLLQAWLALLLAHFKVCPAWRPTPAGAVDLTGDTAAEATPAANLRRAIREEAASEVPESQTPSPQQQQLPQQQRQPPRALPPRQQHEAAGDDYEERERFFLGALSTAVGSAVGKAMDAHGKQSGARGKASERLAPARADPCWRPTWTRWRRSSPPSRSASATFGPSSRTTRAPSTRRT